MHFTIALTRKISSRGKGSIVLRPLPRRQVPEGLGALRQRGSGELWSGRQGIAISIMLDSRIRPKEGEGFGPARHLSNTREKATPMVQNKNYLFDRPPARVIRKLRI